MADSPASPGRVPIDGQRWLLIAVLTVAAMGVSVLAITPRVVFWKDYPDMVFETARLPSLVAQLADFVRIALTHPAPPRRCCLLCLRSRLSSTARSC
jgi:hypothetical protein